jgi:predicted Fe-S protein YdhL (DUF1289 family)
VIRTKAALPDKAVQARFREVDCVMDDSQTQAKLVSPCISVCQMDAEKGLCLGCYRTRREIAAWPSMSADEQSALLSELRTRRAAATGVRRRATRRTTQTG